jgi:hypothetical protein
VQIGVTVLQIRGVSSSEAIGRPAASPGVAPVAPKGIPTAAVVSRAPVTTSASVSPKSVTSREVVSRAVLSVGVVSVTPLSVRSAEVAGTTTMSSGTRNIAVRGVSSAERLGSITLTTSSSTIRPVGVGSGQGLGNAATLGKNALAFRGIPGASVVPTSVIRRVIRPSSIGPGDRYGMQVITTSAAILRIRGIPSSEAVGVFVVPSPDSAAEGAAFHWQLFVNPIGPLF